MWQIDGEKDCVLTWGGLVSGRNQDQFKIDTRTSAIHYPVFTRGPYVFDLFRMVFEKYSVPFSDTCSAYDLPPTIDDNNTAFR